MMTAIIRLCKPSKNIINVLVTVLPSLWVGNNGWKTETMGSYDLCYWSKRCFWLPALREGGRGPKHTSGHSSVERLPL